MRILFVLSKLNIHFFVPIYALNLIATFEPIWCLSRRC